jgi:hypothetical protein
MTEKKNKFKFFAIIGLIIIFITGKPEFGFNQIAIWTPKTIIGFNPSEYSGIQFGIKNKCEYAKGIQIGILNIPRDFKGLQIGLFNCPNLQGPSRAVGANRYYGSVRGVQFGLFNRSELLNGFQFGILNITSVSYGFQFGLLNKTRGTYGFHLAFINVTKINKGINLGFINYNNNDNYGLQVGFFNICGHSENSKSNVQIGLLNYQSNNRWFAKILPIVNFKWEKKLKKINDIY